MPLFITCNPSILKTDQETGCNLWSCSDNAQSEYEQCRQSFYAKQQVILEKQKITTNPTCEYSEYQKQISDLQISSLKLENENQDLKTKYQSLSETKSNCEKTLPTEQSNKLLANIISYQGIIILMTIIIISLGYLLYKNRLRK
jgi:hypothetical protein